MFYCLPSQFYYPLISPRHFDLNTHWWFFVFFKRVHWSLFYSSCVKSALGLSALCIYIHIVEEHEPSLFLFLTWLFTSVVTVLAISWNPWWICTGGWCERHTSILCSWKLVNIMRACQRVKWKTRKKKKKNVSKEKRGMKKELKKIYCKYKKKKTWILSVRPWKEFSFQARN